jgi:hypothetical protein
VSGTCAGRVVRVEDGYFLLRGLCEDVLTLVLSLLCFPSTSTMNPDPEKITRQKTGEKRKRRSLKERKKIERENEGQRTSPLYTCEPAPAKSGLAERHS